MISDAAMQARTARVLTELLIDADRANAPTLEWTVGAAKLTAITHDRAVFDAWVPLIDVEPRQLLSSSRQVWALETVAADETVRVVVTFYGEAIR